MDINSLLDSLTDEDIEKLKVTAAQFMGGVKSDDEKKTENSISQNIGTGSLSPDMLSCVARVAGEMNKSDPKCDFIAALKPLLSPERGKKADDAVMMLKFMRMLDSLKGNFL